MAFAYTSMMHGAAQTRRTSRTSVNDHMPRSAKARAAQAANKQLCTTQHNNGRNGYDERPGGGGRHSGYGVTDEGTPHKMKTRERGGQRAHSPTD
jgi:hypothetical protein